MPDVDAAGTLATGIGANLLHDNDDFRVYADPVGYPFCLYPDESTDKAVVGRLVFDCFSPRALASFYEGFLGARSRIEDTPERVVVDLGDDTLPNLAFQHVQFRAARWPDPDYPAQLHVDYRWHDSVTARVALERAESLGAVRLPQLAGAEIYADPASHPFCIQNEIPIVFDVIGLYVNPPEYAVVYCIDAAGQPQTPTGNEVSPVMTPGVRERRTHDADHDAARMIAAINDAEPATAGSADRATEFRAFLTAVEAAVPTQLEVNLVCDWAGTYEAPAIQSWLSDHAGWQVHRNPPKFGWKEQVARWLDYYIDELTTRGDHTSAQALEADVRSWVGARRDPTPFVCTKTTDDILESLRILTTRLRARKS